MKLEHDYVGGPKPSISLVSSGTKGKGLGLHSKEVCACNRAATCFYTSSSELSLPHIIVIISDVLSQKYERLTVMMTAKFHAPQSAVPAHFDQ